MNLTKRQQQIIDIVKKQGPITANQIAKQLGYSKSTLRSDFNLLTHLEILDAKPRVGYILNKQPKENIHPTISQFSLKVKEVKSPAVCILESSSLHDAIIQIFLHDAGTIFVTDEDEFLCGIVSRKDFLKSIVGHSNIHTVPVSIIMTRMPNIIMTTDGETVLEAGQKIIKHKIDALPVVEKVNEQQYKITGRISKTTLSKLFVEVGCKINH